MIITFDISPPGGIAQTATFKVLGTSGIYSVRIPIKLGIPEYEVEGCACIHGSWFGHSKKNRAENKVCKHMIECLNFLEREGWLDPNWKNRIENGTERTEEINAS